MLSLLYFVPMVFYSQKLLISDELLPVQPYQIKTHSGVAVLKLQLKDQAIFLPECPKAISRVF